MTPREFARLTPDEFEALVAGWGWREERTWDVVAILGAFLVNTSGFRKGPPARPEDFLGRFVGQSKVPGYEGWGDPPRRQDNK